MRTACFGVITALSVTPLTGCGPHVHAAATSPSSSNASSSAGTGNEIATGASGRADELAVGDHHACARSGERVLCWGADGRSDGPSPHPIPNLGKVKQLTLGRAHTCALRDDGRILCFGANQRGQLGDGTTTPRGEPKLVADIYHARGIAAGGDETCAVLENGSVSCFGADDQDRSISTPLPLFEVGNAVAVSVGTHHGCVKVQTGDVRCFGKNNVRQLGVPLYADRGLAAVVPQLRDASELAAGDDASCAIVGGQMLCWGGGLRCLPGEPVEGRIVAVKPAPITGLGAVEHVAVGGDRPCAVLKGTGEVACADAVGPMRECRAAKVFGLSGVTRVSMSRDFGCAITADGAIVCFGANGSGELGQGDTAARAAPVTVRLP